MYILAKQLPTGRWRLRYVQGHRVQKMEEIDHEKARVTMQAAMMVGTRVIKEGAKR